MSCRASSSRIQCVHHLLLLAATAAAVCSPASALPAPPACLLHRQRYAISAVAVEAAATTSSPTKRVEGLQTPHGGKLVNLMVPEAQRQAVIDSCTKTLACSDRNACDVELLVVG